MKKIHKFFSKDLLHILGAVGIFVAFLIFKYFIKEKALSFIGKYLSL